MYLAYTTDKVAAEKGLTSGVLDEASDQEGYEVYEGEESSEEEEEDQRREVLSDYL